MPAEKPRNTKSLNAANLEALGAPRLAELLIEISTGNAAAKQRLRLELAGLRGGEDVAKEVRKRLLTLGRARNSIDAGKLRTLVDDLETQRKAIAGKVASENPKEALDLAWMFVETASSVHDRCHDRSGTLAPLFVAACVDLAGFATAAAPNARELAEKTFAALMANDYGQYEGLLSRLHGALGREGSARLKELAQPVVDAPPPAPAANRRLIGYGTGGPIYADTFEHDARKRAARAVLRDLADADGDPDAFMAQVDDRTRTVPTVAADIALRYIRAARPQEALAVLDNADRATGTNIRQWEDARIDVLDALGRSEDAQALRLSVFEMSLSAAHLRAYLKRFPDFDDIEAEERALDGVARHPRRMMALSFLVDWPALDRAARLITARPEALDGDRYYLLGPAAEALGTKHPLAATLALRAMIEFTLARALNARYGHAARHFEECGHLAPLVEDFGDVDDHETFAARIRSQHGKKTAFWGLLR